MAVFRPNLPSPPPMAQTKRIAFSKPIEEVRLVADYFFDDPDTPPSAVGEACFQDVLDRVESDE
ncbi:MAG: hypothetical protein AAGM27_11995 [Cyanobacteria bacterium J06554_3]